MIYDLNRPVVRAAAALFLVATLGACGSDLSPTAPPFPETLPLLAGGLSGESSSMSGVLLSGGEAASSSASGGAPRANTTSGVQVFIEGSSQSVVTDSNGRFLLINIPSGDLMLRIVGGGVDARLVIEGVGSSQLVRVTVQVATSSAQVVTVVHDALQEFEGALANVDGATSAFSLDDGRTFVVDPLTFWDSDGDIQSFGALADAHGRGQAVDMEGRFVTTATGALLATVIKAETDDADVEVDGFVSTVDPSASSLTLMDGTVVRVDAATTEWKSDGDFFSLNAVAAAIAAGTFVEVEAEGSRLADGSILAAKIKAEGSPFELEFKPDEWALEWIGSGSSGTGGSAVEARIEDGPVAHIVASSVTISGPSATVVAIRTETDDHRFVASITKGDAASIIAGAVAGDTVEVSVSGSLVDGTPWTVSATVEVVDGDDDDDDDEDDDEDDDDKKLDPAVAAQAITDVRAVIDALEELVDDGDVAANTAGSLISKLEAAIGSLQKLNRKPAVNQLKAFLNALEAAEKTGKISEDDAEVLEDLVKAIKDALDSDDDD